MFTDSGGVYSWLCSFINLERGLGGKPGADGGKPEEHFRLDRMRLLAEMAGHPERSAPVIHIAGSKGKGSVCAMTGAVLEAAGKRPGRYMSPHVVDWRERICLGGGYFSEADYTDAGNELFSLYRNYSLSSGFCGEPTFFELITLLFFLCSRNARCLCMVVETGLGGRLDATNIVDPRVTVISAIEKEHTEYLGGSVEKIAEEKAGIVKRRKPLVLAGQNEPVLDVFLKKAAEQEAPLIYLPRAAAAEQVRLTKNGTSFALKFTDPEFAGLSADYSIGVPGAVYPKNAALALLAAKKAFPDLSVDGARAGLAAFRLPARFEARDADTGGPFIVDGAHTPQSAALCAETFCELYGSGGILLFGCAKEKDPDGMAEALLPHFSQVIITSPGTFRESDPENVYGAFCRAAGGSVSGGSRPSVSLVPDTKSAFEEAVRAAKEKTPVLVCGSFYLAGEVIRYSAACPGQAHGAGESPPRIPHRP